jgi:hypothetical protein
MVEENGMPMLGATATMLGIRIGKDVVPDVANAVHRPAFQPGGENGLSCAATIASLPAFTLPVERGGLNKRTVVWRIEEIDLPIELTAGDDSRPGGNRHISIGPSMTMDYNDFVIAVEATRPHWKKVTKN